MFKKKEFQDTFVHKNKIRIAFLLLLILGLCVLMRLTPIIEYYYWVNVITNLIVDSTFSILVIAGLLIVIHIVEIKLREEKLQRDGDENVDG